MEDGSRRSESFGAGGAGMLRIFVKEGSFSGVVRDDAVPGRDADPDAGSVSMLKVDALALE